MKKLPNINNSDNTVIKVIVLRNEQKYELIGVLIDKKNNVLRIAFTAKNDKVKDFLDIKEKDIVSIEKIKNSEILNI